MRISYIGAISRDVGKNIVIFSDGTGQRSGLFLDENRSNIYKLYRATRCGPDKAVDPAEQLTFYDPGIGTSPIGENFFLRLYRRAYNVVSQATVLGLTRNVIDCYAPPSQTLRQPYALPESRHRVARECQALILTL